MTYILAANVALSSHQVRRSKVSILQTYLLQVLSFRLPSRQALYLKGTSLIVWKPTYLLPDFMRTKCRLFRQQALIRT